MGIAKIARRTFLLGSVAVAGGVAFGYYQYKKPIPNPLLDGLGDGEAAITPYVKIDANGVTLITPRADKGQGAYSIQAYLLAEELDVDPLSVALTPGMPSAAYYNSKVMDEAFPFAATDDSFVANSVRGLGDVVTRMTGMQMTGGSSTVPDGYEKLRHAGAVARETLKEAAAVRAGVSRSNLKTEDGHVVLPDGARVSYVELASQAAKVEPITDVTLRDPSEWRFLGKPVQRTDIVGKSTGLQKYGIDLSMEGMLYATVRANPGFGGAVTRFDASAAEAMRGVKKVVPVKSGVAVVADNTWRAFQAVAAIDVEWGAGPYPKTSLEMWDVLNTHIDEAFQDHQNKNEGDVTAALTSGEEAIDVEYKVPYLAHAPLEPMNALVLVESNRVDIWTGTQIPRFIQNHVAELTGLGVDDVHVHAQAMGGSFGHRLEDTYVLQAVEIGMAMKGTPIKMTWSREEDMGHDYPRPMAFSKARGKVKGGAVEACDLDIVSQSVATSWFGRLMMAPPGPDQIISTGAWDQPYAIPNYRVTGYRAPEMVPVSSWRSVGASGNGFIHESFVDELIHAAGADPLEERLRLCNHDVSRKVLEAVGEMSNWNGSQLGPDRGRGIAFVLSFGVPVAEVVEVTNTADGIKIDKVYVACDVGRVLDPVNLEAQVTGGVIFGLGHAMNCELTYDDYAVQQNNYHAYEGMRLYQAPEMEVRALENGSEIKGIGEPGVPPAAPALANAIFAATGQRIRELPLNKSIQFV